MNGLSDALAKEGSDWTRKATNQVWLGFLLNMLSSMHDVLEVCFQEFDRTSISD